MDYSRKGINVLVFVDNDLWDSFLLLKTELLNTEVLTQHLVNVSQNHSKDVTSVFETYNNGDVTQQNIPVRKMSMDGYALSLCVNHLKSSKLYRKLVIFNFRQLSRCKTAHPIYVRIQLKVPRSEAIDLKWNQRIEWMLMERRELDSALSWFSTFGGAFSALGEEFEHCADMAGKISLQQLSLALRLGDPLTVSRCRLYWALSRIQRGELRSARAIILTQLSLARAHTDDRLERMCFGIWARLKYEHHRRRLARRAISDVTSSMANLT